jgi:hypothetical protein
MDTALGEVSGTQREIACGFRWGWRLRPRATSKVFAAVHSRKSKTAALLWSLIQSGPHQQARTATAKHDPPGNIGRVLGKPQRRIRGDDGSHALFQRDRRESRAEAVVRAGSEAEQSGCLWPRESVGIKAVGVGPCRGIAAGRGGAQEDH